MKKLSLILILSLFMPNLSLAASELPYKEEILSIISPLVYTRFHLFTKPDVNISIDFKNNKWVIHHVHVFDKNGNLKIDHELYGVCSDLAVHTYQKLKPIISNDFYLKFAMSLTDDVFINESSNHIVLLLTDLKANKLYLLDPSFQKYNSIENSNGYKILSVNEMLKFVQDKNIDEEFNVNNAMPLFRYKDSLISLSINSVDGVFDEKNYLLSINVYRKGLKEVLDMVSIGKVNNEIRSYLNKSLMNEFFTDNEIEIMVGRLKSWLF